MTPAREHLIEQAIQGHAGTRMAMQWLFDQANSAGRAQGLREAREAVQKRYMGDNNREDAEVLRCAAAIQQLEGK